METQNFNEIKSINGNLDEIGIKYAFNFGKGKNYTGGDKTSLGNNFTEVYDVLFYAIRDDSVNLLELGVFHGKSLAMWSDYFTNGKIYGIDIDLKPYNENLAKLSKLGAFKNNNVSVFEMDVKSKNFAEFIHTMPKMDIIIDDALHQADTQLNNFKLLFPILNKGGLYIIEDIVESVKFTELFKDIYMCVSNSENSIIKKNPSYAISTKIEYIKICQNMIIIRKKIN
jgi:cephalosporin hydroxylase